MTPWRAAASGQQCGLKTGGVSPTRHMGQAQVQAPTAAPPLGRDAVGGVASDPCLLLAKGLPASSCERS